MDDERADRPQPLDVLVGRGDEVGLLELADGGEVQLHDDHETSDDSYCSSSGIRASGGTSIGIRGASFHKPFEVVVLARGVQEHVHDEVAVVEQRPLAARARGLGADRAQALVLEPALDAVRDRVDLAIAASGQHELVVAERAQLAHVE